MLTNREAFIKKIFLPDQRKADAEYMSDEEAEVIVKKITKIGESLGFIGVNLSSDQSRIEQRKHKYDVWIAKEVKKDENIINRLTDLRLIIDWVIELKVNIFQYSFQDAFEAQSIWHLEMLNRYQIEDLIIPNIDQERIVFKFSDGIHFLYLLNAEELKYEGKIMGHCVGGVNYKQKIKNGAAIILSIRDSKNYPHVTIEIEQASKMVVQQQGRGNSDPIQKYKNLIREFLFFSTNFEPLENKEVLKFLNSYFISKK